MSFPRPLLACRLAVSHAAVGSGRGCTGTRTLASVSVILNFGNIRRWVKSSFNDQAVGALQSTRTVLGFSWFLVCHPGDFRRLGLWLSQRSASPMDLRVPWWPYDATTWLAAQLPAHARVFEYGGGGSTLWLHDHSARITVVEHDPQWVAQLRTALPAAATIVERDVDTIGSITSQAEDGFFDSYVAAIDSEPDESLDLVIVDGRARVDCVKRAAAKVRPGGLLILDDSQRARYQPAVELLAAWERHVFAGLKPGDLSPAQTSAWRKP